jgi:bacteriocin-like protein
MSDDKNKQDELKQTNEEINEREELADEELNNVSGGVQLDPLGRSTNPGIIAVRKAGDKPLEY